MSCSDEPSNLHQLFDLQSIRSVPDSHTWSNLQDHPILDSSGPNAESIPIIDLTAVDAASLLGRACEDWGVFQVIGHGLSTCLLKKVDLEARRLFSLPLDRKLKAARAAGSLSGYGLAPLSSFFSKYMWSEGFTVAGSSLDHARKLWPDQDPTQFCDVMEEYNKEVETLARRLMKMIISSLNFTKNEIKHSANVEDFQDISAVIQLNWYPDCPDPDRAMGLAAHTDSGLLTVLYQSNSSIGLQVLCSEGGNAWWVSVPPVPSALVVNIGDLAHILSNGRYRSIIHRAVVNRTIPRLSVAYICGPAANVKISPATRPAKYRPITWQEYRALKSKLFDKALTSIEITAQEDVNDDHEDKRATANNNWAENDLRERERERDKELGEMPQYEIRKAVDMHEDKDVLVVPGGRYEEGFFLRI